MNEKKSERLEVPAQALTFGGEMLLGDNGEDAKTVPVKLNARTGQPIDHWFWGRIVHDLDGMRLHKKRLPLDYAHDEKEVVGYLSHFETDSGDLVASGAVIPFTDTDRASEIIHKSKNGVPYEASINFGGDDLQLEEISDGESCSVNGYEFAGPGVVVRSWPLRGVAVCPYGADAGTSTEFAAGSTVSLTIKSRKGFQMPDPKKFTAADVAENQIEKTEQLSADVDAELEAIKQKEYHEEIRQAAELIADDRSDDQDPDQVPPVAEAATDEQVAEESPEVAEESPEVAEEPAETTASDRGNEYKETQPADQERAKLASDFANRFGARRGIDYFAAGLSIEQATERFSADLLEENETIQTENQELRQRLAAADLGEDPVAFAKSEAEQDIAGETIDSLSALWKANRRR